jgi:hypothetical protein
MPSALMVHCFRGNPSRFVMSFARAPVARAYRVSFVASFSSLVPFITARWRIRKLFLHGSIIIASVDHFILDYRHFPFPHWLVPMTAKQCILKRNEVTTAETVTCKLDPFDVILKLPDRTTHHSTSRRSLMTHVLTRHHV